MNKVLSKILSELKGTEDFVSGEVLCHKLGVSRVSVSNNVKALRDLGYVIESVPRKGHRMVHAGNIPLLEEVAPYLKSKLIGCNYEFYRSIDSTNKFLMDLSHAECVDGMVVVADNQTSGRGRLTRKWHSPPKCNLYFSVLLKPKKSPSMMPQLALVAAVAITQALRSLFPELNTGVKWPNDVLINGRKLAGVICELEAEADLVHRVVMGIGINVNMKKSDFVSDIRKTATSLCLELNHDIERPRLMAELLNSLDSNYKCWMDNGLAPFLPKLKEMLVSMGKEVSVNTLDDRVVGDICGLSDDGGLVLRTTAGERVIRSGEICLSNDINEKEKQGV